jgi:hypothetical protein
VKEVKLRQIVDITWKHKDHDYDEFQNQTKVGTHDLHKKVNVKKSNVRINLQDSLSSTATLIFHSFVKTQQFDDE